MAKNGKKLGNVSKRSSLEVKEVGGESFKTLEESKRSLRNLEKGFKQLIVNIAELNKSVTTLKNVEVASLGIDGMQLKGDSERKDALEDAGKSSYSMKEGMEEMSARNEAGLRDISKRLVMLHSFLAGDSKKQLENRIDWASFEHTEGIKKQRSVRAVQIKVMEDFNKKYKLTGDDKITGVGGLSTNKRLNNEQKEELKDTWDKASGDKAKEHDVRIRAKMHRIINETPGLSKHEDILSNKPTMWSDSEGKAPQLGGQGGFGESISPLLKCCGSIKDTVKDIRDLMKGDVLSNKEAAREVTARGIKATRFDKRKEKRLARIAAKGKVTVLPQQSSGSNMFDLAGDVVTTGGGAWALNKAGKYIWTGKGKPDMSTKPKVETKTKPKTETKTKPAKVSKTKPKSWWRTKIRGILKGLDAATLKDVKTALKLRKFTKLKALLGFGGPIGLIVMLGVSIAEDALADVVHEEIISIENDLKKKAEKLKAPDEKKMSEQASSAFERDLKDDKNPVNRYIKKRAKANNSTPATFTTNKDTGRLEQVEGQPIDTVATTKTGPSGLGGKPVVNNNTVNSGNSTTVNNYGTVAPAYDPIFDMVEPPVIPGQ